MKVKELRHLVQMNAQSAADPGQLDMSIRSAFHQCDELVSAAGNGIGATYGTVDISNGSDLYSAADYIRVLGVQRREVGIASWYPMNYTPAAAMIHTYHGAVGVPGSHWTFIGDQIQIFPMPDADVVDGLRIWGYPKHTFDSAMDSDSVVDFPYGCESLAIWIASHELAITPAVAKRAERNVTGLVLTLTKLLASPQVGPPAGIMKERR